MSEGDKRAAAPELRDALGGIFRHVTRSYDVELAPEERTELDRLAHRAAKLMVVLGLPQPNGLPFITWPLSAHGPMKVPAYGPEQLNAKGLPPTVKSVTFRDYLHAAERAASP
jgi:hypothetical protein